MTSKKSTRSSRSDLLLEWALLLTVFTTGGCILVVEVIATRILSPYFGSTIYAFSSVISTVLGALSIGYYVGGKYADRHPKLLHFYTLIIIGGLSVLLMTAISTIILPIWGYRLSMVTGPLFISVLLFSIPSFLLGMLSPFAIRLQQEICANEGIGSIAGKVFFWSTLGSIAGSLLAGFALIPHLGIRESLIIVSCILVGLGLIGITVQHYGIARKTLIAIVTAILFHQSILLFQYEPIPSNLVYRHDGTYERIAVMDGMHQDRPVRYLMLDRGFSSAEYLDGDGIVFDYVNYYKLHQALAPHMKRSLVIGAGAYTIPRVLAAETGSPVDVVDIEPELLPVSKKFFKLEDSDLINHHFTDGRRFLHDTEARYDFIFGDAFGSIVTVPAHMTSLEFFELLRGRLAPNGAFVGNFIGSLADEKPSFLLSMFRTFRTVFPNSQFYAVQNLDNTQQNIIFVGINGDQSIDPCSLEFKNNKDPMLQTICERRIDLTKYDLEEHTLFTDNFSPTEYYTAQALKYSKS